MTTKQFYQMVNHKSGLLGVSETSSTCGTCSRTEPKIFERRKLWRCSVIRRKSGSAPSLRTLGGVDALVFAGSISADASRVAVRVIRTDEDLMITRSVSRILETGDLTPSG
jgi:acetate kinase